MNASQLQSAKYQESSLNWHRDKGEGPDPVGHRRQQKALYRFGLLTQICLFKKDYKLGWGRRKKSLNYVALILLFDGPDRACAKQRRFIIFLFRR